MLLLLLLLYINPFLYLYICLFDIPHTKISQLFAINQLLMRSRLKQFICFVSRKTSIVADLDCPVVCSMNWLYIHNIVYDMQNMRCCFYNHLPWYPKEIDL